MHTRARFGSDRTYVVQLITTTTTIDRCGGWNTCVPITFFFESVHAFNNSIQARRKGIGNSDRLGKYGEKETQDLILSSFLFERERIDEKARAINSNEFFLFCRCSRRMPRKSRLIAKNRSVTMQMIRLEPRSRNSEDKFVNEKKRERGSTRLSRRDETRDRVETWHG